MAFVNFNTIKYAHYRSDLVYAHSQNECDCIAFYVEFHRLPAEL